MSSPPRVSRIQPSHMAEVMDVPADALDRPERQSSPAGGSPLPPPPPPPAGETAIRESALHRWKLKGIGTTAVGAARARLIIVIAVTLLHGAPHPQEGSSALGGRMVVTSDAGEALDQHGYDYGGYDRGRRGGYDDRFQGRYMSRPSDWPDSGRGGFDGSQPQGYQDLDAPEDEVRIYQDLDAPEDKVAAMDYIGVYSS